MADSATTTTTLDAQPTETPAGAPLGANVKGKPIASAEMKAYLTEDVTGADGKPIQTEDIAPLEIQIPEKFKDALAEDEVKAYVDVAANVLRREGPNAKPHVIAQAILQELTNKTIELGSSRERAVETENENAVAEQVLAWRREVATDPQLGGTNYTQSMVQAEEGARRLGGHAAAVAFIRHLRGEEVMPAPMLVKMFHLAAATMREDRIHGLIINKGTQTKSLAESLYGTSSDKAGVR